jgi:hypothetical protein
MRAGEREWERGKREGEREREKEGGERERGCLDIFRHPVYMLYWNGFMLLFTSLGRARYNIFCVR